LDRGAGNGVHQAVRHRAEAAAFQTPGYRLRGLEGELPPRALGLVIEWATRHHDELRRAWEQSANHEPLTSIEPLR
jgi:hypothetical protein